MLGLMYLGAASLYLALMFFVVRGAWRQGRAGGSVLKACVFSLLAFLAVYMPVFWNWIPAASKFKQVCATDAGFFVTISAQDWRESHRDAIDSLGPIDPNKSTSSFQTPSGYWRSRFFGGLLANDSQSSYADHFGVRFGRHESRVVDTSSEHTLAKAVNYTIGSPEDIRIWLARQSCFAENNHPITKLAIYKSQLKGE